MLSARTESAVSRKHPHVVWLALFILLAGLPARARGEEDVLKLVPEQALGFVVVKGLDAVDAKLQQLGRQMNLPIPSLLAKLQGPGGIRKGLDKDRPLALLALPPKDENGLPIWIVLVPVSDYAAALEQFKPEDAAAEIAKIEIGGTALAVRKVGAYAAITMAASRDALEKDVKIADEVPAALAPWRAWLAKKDAAAVVLAPGIRLLSDKVQKGIATIKPLLARGGERTKAAAAGLDMYVTLFQAAETEVVSGGLGAELDAQGVVRLTKRALLTPGGAWAALAAEAKPAKHNVLAGLPDEPFIFAAGGPLPEAASGNMMSFSFGLIKNMHEMYGLSEEQAETLSEFGKQKFPAIRGFSFVFGAGQSGEPIFSRTFGIMRIKDREKFLAEYEKFIVRYNRIAKKVNSPVFQPIKLEKTEFDGMPALKVTMKVPQMPNMPPESVKMVQRMYGPGGKVVAWVVPCNDRSVVFSYVGDEPLRRIVAAVKQGKPGLAGNAEVAKAVALLPPGTSWSLYCSPKGCLEFLKQTIAAASPAGLVKIPEFPSTPPVAIALTTGADEVEIQMVVPAEVMKAIGGLMNQRLRPVTGPGEIPESIPESSSPTPQR